MVVANPVPYGEKLLSGHILDRSPLNEIQNAEPSIPLWLRFIVLVPRHLVDTALPLPVKYAARIDSAVSREVALTLLFRRGLRSILAISVVGACASGSKLTPYSEGFSEVWAYVEELEALATDFRDTNRMFEDAFWDVALENAEDFESVVVGAGPAWSEDYVELSSSFVDDERVIVNKLRSLSLGNYERSGDLDILRSAFIEHLYAWEDYALDRQNLLTDWVYGWTTGRGAPYQSSVLEELEIEIEQINDSHRTFCDLAGELQPSRTDFSELISALCAD